VSAAERTPPVSAAEAKPLFADLRSASALLLAVSGGPDSTALMVLIARWRAALRKGPRLFALTVDHGLRAESAREARAAKQIARRLGIPHRTMRWIGDKPQSGLQEAARMARYRLLASAARAVGATHILTAHTLDDQAETVLLRMARGSGMTGLAAMARLTPLWGQVREVAHRPSGGVQPLWIVRPLLDLSKARLVATLDAARVASCEDPSNSDPRFTRARLRQLMPALAGEGLDSRRLALLARRLRRAEATIELAVGAAAVAVSEAAWRDRHPIRFDAERFIGLPAEVALRLLGRAIVQAGGEGPLRLGRLEALYELIAAPRSQPARARVRRTLAGALVTLAGERLTVEPAPPRSKAQRAGAGRGAGSP
jgi:tRNA(Ile)-lysidine synthase